MQQVVDFQATDPAHEFATLAERMRQHAINKNAKTYEGLAGFIGVENDDPRLFEMIGVLSSRAVSLMDFIHTTQDEFLDDDMRIGLVEAAHKISQVFNPRFMQEAWHGHTDTHIKIADLRALRSFAQIARKHRKLRLITPEERDRLLAAIDDSLSELTNQNELPGWAIMPLKDGVRRLKFMLEHFDIFGHDQLIDQLIRIDGEAKASSSLLDTMKDLADHRLVKTAGVIALGVNLLLMPPRVIDGYLSYRGYVHQLVEHPPKLLVPPQKMLAPPNKPKEA